MANEELDRQFTKNLEAIFTSWCNTKRDFSDDAEALENKLALCGIYVIGQLENLEKYCKTKRLSFNYYAKLFMDNYRGRFLEKEYRDLAEYKVLERAENDEGVSEGIKEFLKLIDQKEE